MSIEKEVLIETIRGAAQSCNVELAYDQCAYILHSISEATVQPTPDYVRGMERAAEIAEAEKVDADETGSCCDISYNAAIDHTIAAIRKEAAEQAPAVEVTEAMAALNTFVSRAKPTKSGRKVCVETWVLDDARAALKAAQEAK